jgi:hypothetical protein
VNVAIRKKLKNNGAKIVECLILTFITVSVFYFAPLITKGNCIKIDEGSLEVIIEN